MSANNIENHANSLANATSNVEGTFDWDKALNPEDNDSDYFIAAEAIVEPKGVEDDYYEFVENDPDNWVGFVTNTCGEQWGQLARVSLEYGY